MIASNIYSTTSQPKTYAQQLQDTLNNYATAIYKTHPASSFSFGNDPSTMLPTGQSTTTNSVPETAVLDPVTGLYKSNKTGAAWTGAVTNANGTVSHAQNGKLLPMDAYGNTLPVFGTIDTVKQPGIAQAATGLLNQSNDNAAALTKSFNDYLKQANDLNAQSKTQLATDQAAVDPTDTINRLNTDTANTTKALGDINNQYTTNQNLLQGNVASENKSAADTTTARLAKLKADLDAQNAQYESAAQNVATQAYDKARGQISAYQLGTGTPTSASGDVTNRYMRAYQQVNVPLQQDLANRRLQQTTALDQQQQQADSDAYRNLINQYSGQAALNTDLANRYGDTTKYTGQLDAATAAQVQQLKIQTAGMSRAQAATYLQQLQIPLEVGQQVLNSQIQNLQGIQGIDANANYYTNYTSYDPSRVATTTTNGAQAPRSGNNGANNYTNPGQTISGNGPDVSGGGGPPAQVTSLAGMTPVSDNSGGTNYQDAQGNIYSATGRLVYAATVASTAPTTSPRSSTATPQYSNAQLLAAANDYYANSNDGYDGSGAGGGW